MTCSSNKTFPTWKNHPLEKTPRAHSSIPSFTSNLKGLESQSWSWWMKMHPQLNSNTYTPQKGSHDDIAGKSRDSVFFDIGDRNWLIHVWFFHCHVSFRGCRRACKGWSGWLRYGFWYFICKCFYLLYIHGQSLGMTQMVISILCLLLVCGILRKIAKLISSHDYF